MPISCADAEEQFHKHSQISQEAMSQLIELQKTQLEEKDREIQRLRVELQQQQQQFESHSSDTPNSGDAPTAVQLYPPACPMPAQHPTLFTPRCRQRLTTQRSCARGSYTCSCAAATKHALYKTALGAKDELVEAKHKAIGALEKRVEELELELARLQKRPEQGEAASASDQDGDAQTTAGLEDPDNLMMMCSYPGYLPGSFQLLHPRPWSDQTAASATHDCLPLLPAQ